MARPLKQGMDYFPHNINASDDERMKKLRDLYGNDGYAFYFISLEQIYKTYNAELNFSDSTMCLNLAKKIGISLDRFCNILEFALDIGCFDKTRFEIDMVLTNESIKQNFQEMSHLRARWKKNQTTNTLKNKVKKTAENLAINKTQSPAIGMSENLINDITEVPTETKSDKTIENKAETPAIKQINSTAIDLEKKPAENIQEGTKKKSRTKKSNNVVEYNKPDKIRYAEFVTMTASEYELLISKVGEKGAKRCVEILDNYKGSSGRKYASDYRTMLSWVIDRYEQEKVKNGGEKHERKIVIDERLERCL